MITTYNCFCFDCPTKGKFQIELEEQVSDITCPVCGSLNTKILGQTCSVFGKFNSLPPKEKQRILKKRSDDHFKKTLKEKKEHLDRAAIGLAQ